MKKLIVFILLISAGSLAYSQVLPLDLGIKAGANYSLIGTDVDGLSADGTASFTGGAFARLKIKKWRITGEVLFVNVQGESEIEVLGEKRTTDLSYSNVDFPILLGRELLDLKVLKLGLNAGVIQSVNVGGGDAFKDFGTDRQ